VSDTLHLWRLIGIAAKKAVFLDHPLILLFVNSSPSSSLHPLSFRHYEIMATTANLPGATASDFGEDPMEPQRILVQKKTHLVPGDDYDQRLFFMLDLICQHQWNRDYVPGRDRWIVYGAQFCYENRRCCFLLDHGQILDDNNVPVLWYEWTGEGESL
jgi:hypothetical protein